MVVPEADIEPFAPDTATIVCVSIAKLAVIA